MDWVAVGAVSEIVGAAAVVVSVVYLALQIRSQTIESRLAATRDLATKRTDALKQFVGNEALIKTWLKAIRDYDTLEGAERMTASLLFNLVLRNAEQEFIHQGTGHADDPYLESVDRVLSQNLAFPGIQQWWATTGDLFNSAFQAHVNRLIENADDGILGDAFAVDTGNDGAA